MSNAIRSPGVKISLAEAIQAGEKTIVKPMQILKTGKFFDPRYKWFDITEKMLSEMILNFNKQIRGIVPALDYAHESEGIAAGWIKSLEIRKENGVTELWGNVELTPKAQKTLSDKEFGYISADFDDNYQDNETGQKHGCVLLGAALTNRPVIKGMDAVIQLSENDNEKNKLPNKEGVSMDQKEMEKKLADAEKMLGDYKKLMEDAGVASMEELMKMIAAKKQASEVTETPEEKAAVVELGDMKKELAETKKQLVEFQKKAQTAEKEAEFTKLLSEGKAVAAQREAFLDGNMTKFVELAVPVKLSEEGNSKTPASASGDVDEEILKEAKKLAEEKGMPINKAISEVLLTNKSLAEKRVAQMN
jgi:phage I-like protein